MNININKNITEPTLQKPLRLLPGIIIVILQWLIRFVIPVFMPGAIAIGIFGGLIGGLAIVIWWVFFSRAPRFDRWIAVFLMILALVATSRIIDKSISTSMMGLMFIVYSIPVLSIAFVAWAVASRSLSKGLRQITMIATILLSSGFWVFLRSDGMDGESHHYFAWRWAKTTEDRLLARADDKLTTTPLNTAITKTEAEWPGFRGANRDGIIHGIRIATDWVKSPPVEMWRRSVGPGCSSFAIHGSLLFTQEQRGEYEMVTCYKLNTGEPVWRHSDKARFWDSHAGAGPRSTPTLSNGRVYTLGATGILNVLDERDGTVVWSRDAAKDYDVKMPGWGCTGSPLLVDNIVIVAISGKLVAYDLATGHQRWAGPDGGDNYSSPHLFSTQGVRQVLFVSKEGLAGFAPENGKVLWKLPIPGVMTQIIQPALVNENDLLISAGYTKGMKRVAIKNESDGWTIKESWASDVLIQNYNDFVVHKGYVYGFEGTCLACVDIEKGNRVWRGGRYGGQIILLADQNLLLVLSEKGELALVEANPNQYKELARFPAIRGKAGTIRYW